MIFMASKPEEAESLFTKHENEKNEMIESVLPACVCVCVSECVLKKLMAGHKMMHESFSSLISSSATCPWPWVSKVTRDIKFRNDENHTSSRSSKTMERNPQQPPLIPIHYP